jgi:hypothetical protein
VNSISSKARRRAIVALLVVLLAMYVGSYCVLSRRGMRANAAVGADGFGYFAPGLGRLTGGEGEQLLHWEYVVHVVYWPAYAVDHCVLGGPQFHPIHGPM